MFVRFLVGLSARLHKNHKTEIPQNFTPLTLVWIQLKGKIQEPFVSLSFIICTWFKNEIKNQADLGGWCLWLSTRSLLTAALVSSGFTWLWIKEVELSRSGGCCFNLRLHVEVSSSKKLMSVPLPCECVCESMTTEISWAAIKIERAVWLMISRSTPCVGATAIRVWMWTGECDVCCRAFRRQELNYKELYKCSLFNIQHWREREKYFDNSLFIFSKSFLIKMVDICQSKNVVVDLVTSPQPHGNCDRLFTLIWKSRLCFNSEQVSKNISNFQVWEDKVLTFHLLIWLSLDKSLHTLRNALQKTVLKLLFVYCDVRQIILDLDIFPYLRKYYRLKRLMDVLIK